MSEQQEDLMVPRELKKSSTQEPWFDTHVTKEVMDFLWNSIGTSVNEQKDARGTLAGNISKSKFIQDKDNWFYENVLKGLSEQIYYRDWNNYCEVVVADKPPPIFSLKTLWVNYQKQYEFNPSHFHSNGMGYSFVVFMKIPTHWKEQHALPWLRDVVTPVASDFAFILGNGQGRVQPTNFPLSPEDEGRILFFPSWVSHQVYPFYECEEERITISGNIVQKEDEVGLDEKESILEEMKKKVISLEKMIEKEKEDVLRVVQQKIDTMEKIEEQPTKENDETEKNSERS